MTPKPDSAAPRPEFLTLSTESAVCGAAELSSLGGQPKSSPTTLSADQREWLRAEIDRRRRELEAGSEGERRCFGCGQWKPLDEFCKSKRHTGGRSYQCRRCKVKYVKEREKAIRAAGGEAYERLKARHTAAARRRRARAKEETT